MAAVDREIPAEDSIKVVCRFRPLNDSEERAGSKFVVKFPQGQEENCISIGVSSDPKRVTFHRFSAIQLRNKKNERVHLGFSSIAEEENFFFAEGKTLLFTRSFLVDKVVSRRLSSSFRSH